MATTAEIIADIRFFLGNLSTDVISDADMTIIIEHVVDNNPNYTDCDVLYYSTLEVLRWLDRQQSAGDSGSVGSGAVKSQEEKEGNVKVKTEWYDSGTTTTQSGWSDIIDDLLASPNSIGCTVTVSTSKPSGSVIFGGVSQEEADKNFANPDRRTFQHKKRNFWGEPTNKNRWN
jgi:hypothetical protein